MNVNGIESSQVRFDVTHPDVSNYGKVNSEQKKLLGELHDKDARPVEEIRQEYLAKEEEKLALLSHLTDEQKAERLEKATAFIDKHISLSQREESVPVVEDPDVVAVEDASQNDSFELPESPPFAPPGKPTDGPPKRRRVGQVLRGLHRAEIANSNGVDFGRLTSEQWSVVRQFRAGELSFEDAKSKFLQDEEAKLSLLVSSDKISEEEKARRLEKFTGVIERVLAH